MRASTALRAAQVLAAAEFLSALMLPGAYLFPLQHGFQPQYWDSPYSFVSTVLSILFIVVPALTLVGLLLRKKLAFWGLYISPIISFIHGVSAIPLIAYVVPVGYPRLALIAVTNLAAIVAAIWLRLRIGIQFPTMHKKHPEHSAS